MIDIVFGSGGLAKQIFSFDLDVKTWYFYNDQTEVEPALFQESGHIRSRSELEDLCHANPARGIIAVGGPRNRLYFYELQREIGIERTTFISRLANISEHDVSIADGVVIMAGCILESGTVINRGALINIKASITHDVNVGEFSEIGPGALLLGGCSVGEKTLVGAGATVLPKVRVGDNVVIGAGAVVTKDVPDGVMVKGVPGKW